LAAAIYATPAALASFNELEAVILALKDLSRAAAVFAVGHGVRCYAKLHPGCPFCEYFNRDDRHGLFEIEADIRAIEQFARTTLARLVAAAPPPPPPGQPT